MRVREWLSPLVYLSNNIVSLIGVVAVTIAGVSWLFLLPVTLRGGNLHPYVGILIYLFLPTMFILGLLLIPLGVYINRRRQQKQGVYPHDFPALDFQNREFRKLILFVVITTFLNVLITGQLSYGAVRHMDSVSFCGQTCHTVMKPEYTAYQGSPHARVECVQCHIGSGASWFVREQNTLTHTVLLLHIGGGPYGVGIHGRHLGEGVRVRYYASDAKRQTIPWVEYTAGGKSTVYASDAKTPDDSQLRVMDCMDCHNRPTHTFELPERAMNRLMASGEVSPSLPFAKKQGVEILKQNYSSSQDAAARIPAAFEAYYQKNYPAVYTQQPNEVHRSAQAVLSAYQRNVFPEMKVTWGTYLNNIGHTDSDGCFRCHDGSHSSPDKQSIANDCDACHNLLASDEKNPKILTDLGLTKPEKK
ncbi:MAG: cytochrome C [Candidatus Angelobacter sp. Gp1-AA117]|nr:MAG: cytochrome C [Candidatus Angelobacter sp. Gp1-AA117]